MTFSIVDIPAGAANSSSPIVEALKANIGKAISIPLEGKDSNAYRKTLRSSLVARGLLKSHVYRTRWVEAQDVLIVWLEVKPAKESGTGVTQDGSTPERMR